MKEKEPEKMGTIMMMAKGRKVLSILARRILKHYSKLKKK